MQATRILETCLYAGDLSAAERFYHDVIGLEVIGKVEGRHVFFKCGQGVFLVFNPAQTRIQTGDALTHGADGEGHAAFATTLAELGAWRDHLRTHGVEIEKEVVWPSGGRSLYFRDPAHNCLEVATPSLWGLPDLL